jgi:hypothetical protein
MAILYGWMDYVIGGPMEWMEMDARAIHSTAWTKWTVDVEWIATLLPRSPSETGHSGQSIFSSRNAQRNEIAD